MMTITLYKGSKTDGLTRLAKWETLSEQKTYFDSLEKYTEVVKTVRLGDPLRVTQNIQEVTRYNYGNIDYGDGFRYYFNIVNVEMNTETQTDVYYNIDAYETLIMQRPFRWGRAVVHRHSMKMGKSLNPFTPTYRKFISKVQNYNSEFATLFYIRHDDTNNADITYFGQICTRNNVNQFFDGSWFTNCGVPGTISQIVVTGVFNGNTTFFEGLPTAQYDHAYEYTQPDDFFLQINTDNNGLKDILTNDGITFTVIKDARGLDIFVPEENASYTIDQYAYVGFTPSSIKLIIGITSQSNEQKFITLPLESVMAFTDQWQEYNYRQRQIDIDTRNLKMNIDLASGLISAGQQAIIGAVAGPIGGATAKAGAGMMGGSSLLGSLTNYAINAFTAPMEQALIDRQYKNANDALAMIGDLSLSEYNKKRMGIYTFETDASKNYEIAIATGGYYTEMEIDDFTNYFKKGPITADIELLDIGIEAWKEQIKARFSNGVYVV